MILEKVCRVVVAANVVNSIEMTAVSGKMRVEEL